MNMSERYVRAERLLTWNADRLTSDLSIKPHWLGRHGQFWYRFRSASGTEFVLVDPGQDARTGEQPPENYRIEQTTR